MVSKIDLGFLGLGALAVFLIIRGGGKFLENLKLPSIGDISLPTINFPEIKFPSLFSEQTTEDDILSQSGATPQQSNIAKAIDANLNQGIPIPDDIQRQIDLDFENDPNRDPSKFQPTFGRGFTGLEEDRPLPPSTLPPERPLNLLQFASSPRPSLALGEDPMIVQSEIEDQQFIGGGSSFVGGAVRETPINFESLSEIIDRFNVSASQASNIQAEALDNFGDFDFGSNTGRGIGSVFARPDINTELSIGNISNPEFEGLTPVQIAQRLTGGVISNF